MVSTNGGPPGQGQDTAIPDHPATQRHVNAKELDAKLAEPYLPRANLAPSADTPDGTTKGGWNEKHSDKSVLEQHVLFFDRDNDKVIWPLDTYRGFHDLGYHMFWCILAIFIIHSGFSYFTGDSWIPDPFFRISVKNIHRAKHGSDTGTYDAEGRFIPAKFETMFAKFDTEQKGGLTFWEMLTMIRENRMIADPIGWLAAFFEMLATYLLIWPEDGVVKKESIRAIYDGSLFWDIAEKEKTRPHYPFSGLFKHN